MSERAVKFCPLCGSPVEPRERFGRLRPVCSRCGHTVYHDPKVAVVIFALYSDQLLLVRRMHDPGKGLWALPAGFVDYDEDPRLAAARETLEETGIVVEVERLLDVLHRPDADGLADIVIAYQAHAVGGTICAADDAEDAAWFARDHLPETALVTTNLLIQRWLAGGLDSAES